jgi:NAD(P)-dependent dehydrogenase (short-subunit alcohol dehydrogenase family)
VVIIIGTGGIGLAIARRLGSGRQLLITNSSKKTLEAAIHTLLSEGYLVGGQLVDVSSPSSVQELAKAATSLGSIETVVHTAGVSLSSTTTKNVLEINLVGAARVIDAFFPVIEAHSSFICISGMSAYLAPLSSSLEQHLALAPTNKLLEHPEIDQGALDAGVAYTIAKKGNLLRVQAAATLWGSKGARINSISPGTIVTRMGSKELDGKYGDYVRAMVDNSGSRRLGTPNDIAGMAAFLAGDQASFITGSDFLVDGGAVSAALWK